MSFSLSKKQWRFRFFGEHLLGFWHLLTNGAILHRSFLRLYPDNSRRLTDESSDKWLNFEQVHVLVQVLNLEAAFCVSLDDSSQAQSLSFAIVSSFSGF
jgi:hypothetical protein